MSSEQEIQPKNEAIPKHPINPMNPSSDNPSSNNYLNPSSDK
jgi:hypothetical protein